MLYESRIEEKRLAGVHGGTAEDRTTLAYQLSTVADSEIKVRQ